jgi:hypothetical protein
MGTLLILLALGLTLTSGSVARDSPARLQAGPGGAPPPPNRDVCWSEPPDLEGWLIFCDTIDGYWVTGEAANDIIFPSDATIVRARWWGGYDECAVPCDPGMVAPGFTLLFYEDDQCLPAPDHSRPYAEIFVEGAAGETFVGCQSDLRPLYRYEAGVDVPVSGGVSYWFSALMSSHPFPPVWGRLTAGVVTGCESAFGMYSLEGWEGWYPISELGGIPLDMSQELECDVPVAVQPCSWSRIKGLYR